MANAINSESTQLCSTCEESSAPELLYKCTQCNIFEDSKKPVEFLCDLCVASHIKKGHRILDHKGLEPTACSDHRQLCLDYCITCSELFCAKCLGKHRKHDFQSLNEKAFELKAKVFELLNDWEKNEKVALEKSEDVSTIVDIHKMEVEKLVKEVEDTLDKVKENLTAEILSKFREFEDVQSWIERHVASVGQVQSDLRGLLCQSNGILVNSFPTVEAKIGALSTSDSQVKLYQMNKEQFEAREGFKSLNQRIISEISRELSLPEVSVEFSRELRLDKVVYREPTMEELFEAPEGFKSLDQKLFSEIHEQLNFTGVKNESLEPSTSKKKSQFNLKVKIAETAESSSQHLIKKTSNLKAEIGEKPKLSLELRFKSIVGCFTDNCFQVAQSNRSLEIRKYDTKNVTSSACLLRSNAMNSESIVVSKVYYLAKLLVIVFSGENQALVYNLKDSSTVRIPYPTNFDVLCPIKRVLSEITWLFWDSKRHVIRMWPCKIAEKFLSEFPCQNRPVNDIISDCSMPCFFDRSALKIIVFSPDATNHWTACRHSFQEKIDCISSFELHQILVIVTWSVESNASSVYRYVIPRDFFHDGQSRISWHSYQRSNQLGFNLALKVLTVGNEKEKDILFLIERNK